MAASRFMNGHKNLTTHPTHLENLAVCQGVFHTPPTQAKKKKYQKEKKLNALPLCLGFSYFPASPLPPGFSTPRAHTMR